MVALLWAAVGCVRTPPVLPAPPRDAAEAQRRWAARCEDWDDWDAPGPPVPLYGNTYLVGTCGIASILVATESGLALFDGGTAAGASLIAANVEALGFPIDEVALLLTSHEHLDHVGGLAELQSRSGASLVTSVPAAQVFRSGAAHPDDPQAGLHPPIAPATVSRTVSDGDEVRLGRTTFEVMSTPGHTPGALSWRWRSCEGEACLTMVYADSLSPISRDGYRFSDHPEQVAAYRRGLAALRASPCDVLLTPHPSASDLRSRLLKGTLHDPSGCEAYADKVLARLEERLATERASLPP